MNDAKVASAAADREHVPSNPLDDPRVRESIDSGQPPPVAEARPAPLTPEHRSVWVHHVPRRNVLGTALVVVAVVTVVGGVMAFGTDLVWLLS